MTPYEKALELTGGIDLTPEQVSGLASEERAVRFTNINRTNAGLDPIEVNVEDAIGYVPPAPPEPPPAPVTHWEAPINHWAFDDVHTSWSEIEKRVATHIGTRWIESANGTRTLRTFTETDSLIVCFAIRYQAATYNQYAEMLGVTPKAAQRRIKILQRGGYLTIRVANPFLFRIASPTFKSMKLVGLRRRVYAGAESQIVHRLMVTEMGLSWEKQGHRVISEYVIGIDPEARFLFPTARGSETDTHRPDLVVEQVDPTCGVATVFAFEYERTRKKNRELLDAIWATAQSGRVDAVFYMSAELPIVELVEKFATFNMISAETYTHLQPIPDWLTL